MSTSKLHCETCRKELKHKEIDLATEEEKERKKILCIDCRLDFEKISAEQTQREYQVFTENNSRIFPPTEMKILKQLIGGKKVVDEGTISGRIKPRIHELLYIWLPRKKELEKLLQKRFRR